MLKHVLEIDPYQCKNGPSVSFTSRFVYMHSCSNLYEAKGHSISRYLSSIVKHFAATQRKMYSFQKFVGLAIINKQIFHSIIMSTGACCNCIVPCARRACYTFFNKHRSFALIVLFRSRLYITEKSAIVTDKTKTIGISWNQLECESPVFIAGYL